SRILSGNTLRTTRSTVPVKYLFCECFRSFLSLVGWEKNDRRRDGDHSDSFRDRTFARKFADFYWPRLDQWLLGTSTRSGSVTLVDPNFSVGHRHHSHLRDNPTGNRKPACPTGVIHRQALPQTNVPFSPHGDERTDRACVYRLSPRAFHGARYGSQVWLT